MRLSTVNVAQVPTECHWLAVQLGFETDGARAAALVARLGKFGMVMNPIPGFQIADAFNCGVYTTVFIMYLAMGWIPFSDVPPIMMQNIAAMGIFLRWFQIIIMTDGSTFAHLPDGQLYPGCMRLKRGWITTPPLPVRRWAVKTTLQDTQDCV